uniref:protein DGCR6-like n=1 Tax=Callithrix jacchus TaxID=9483 RepID=UPI0023DD3236
SWGRASRKQAASGRPGHGPLRGLFGGGGGRYAAATATLPAAVGAAKPGEGVAQVRGQGGRRPAKPAPGPAGAHRAPPARSSFQQHLSYATLSHLALALLEGTVFKIVQGLLEIQHLTEKSLYNQRLRLQNEHRGGRGGGTRRLLWVGKSRPLLLSVQIGSFPGSVGKKSLRLTESRARRLSAFLVTGVEHWIREEQGAVDRKIVLELDRKVADQQSTLEKAGVWLASM